MNEFFDLFTRKGMMSAGTRPRVPAGTLLHLPNISKVSEYDCFDSLTCELENLQTCKLSEMAHLLIIEDDPELGPLLKRNLELEGYRVTLAADGKLGLELARQGGAHLILLDLMLPLLDGMTVLKRLRRELINSPVIILTAKGTEADRLDGFRAGCDDYVAKPFSLMELIARIRAVLRRSGYRRRSEVVNCGGLIADPDARSLSCDGRNIPLTPREFDLLFELMSHPDQALSRTHLLDEVWGEQTDVTPRTVDTHIASLRAKVEGNPEHSWQIVTVYKVGYMWKTGCP